MLGGLVALAILVAVTLIGGRLTYGEWFYEPPYQKKPKQQEKSK